MHSVTLCCILFGVMFYTGCVRSEAIRPAKAPLVKPREVMIPMLDGVHLAADLYFPPGMKSGEKFPVLLEYLPYRKNDERGSRYRMYSYFFNRGYVVARVDIRGTGNSQGRRIPYEYSDIELDDGEVVIDWLAKQKWSNGNVGMFGISWSGFNSIQMALRQPPALKAFVALMATEDLYYDDGHYYNGIVCTDWMLLNGMKMYGLNIMEAKSWGVEDLSVSERAKKVIVAGADQFGGEACPEVVVALVREGEI